MEVNALTTPGRQLEPIPHRDRRSLQIRLFALLVLFPRKGERTAFLPPFEVVVCAVVLVGVLARVEKKQTCDAAQRWWQAPQAPLGLPGGGEAADGGLGVAKLFAKVVAREHRVLALERAREVADVTQAPVEGVRARGRALGRRLLVLL